MPLLRHLTTLSAHSAWADDRMLAHLTSLAEPPTVTVREFAHVLGAQEVWLARIEQRPAIATVWPDLPLTGFDPLRQSIASSYARFLERADESVLETPIQYVNSAGQSFVTPVSEILLHVAMHSQYHRGKVNAALREARQEPVAVDFIAFVRGAPAAVTR